MATSKNTVRDYLGLGKGSEEQVKNPGKSALYFGAVTAFFNFLISWLIFRDKLPHAFESAITFFIGVSLIMWGYLAWKKNQEQQLR